VLVVVLGVLVLAVGGLLASLEPLTRWETRRILAGLHGMRGTFDAVGIRLGDLSYEIRGLRIDKLDESGKPRPFFQVQAAHAGVYGEELLHGHLVASIDLTAPKLTLVESSRPGERRSPKEAGGLAQRAERGFPLRIDRVQVKGGEIVWVEAREPEQPVLRLHGVEATLENFATRASLARKEPTVLAATGTLQSSGRVQVFATADPLAKSLTFAGQGTVRDLDLREVGSLIESRSDVRPKKGTIDVFARFEAKQGALTGGVRPVVRGADLKAARPGLGPKLKELLADAALHIFKDEKTKAVATTIPIEGTVNGPQTQVVPTIMGVLRNAFVRGLQGGLRGLPPPRAEKPQGVVEQARRALDPGAGQPRAQPKERGRE
jgi:hypothetical protein